jgi:rubrerythrin
MYPCMLGKNMYNTHNNQLLELIKEAMLDERHDFIKYRNLIELTDNREIKENIRFAHLDEGKHYKMFQDIYIDLTGENIEVQVPEVEKYRLIDGVKTSIQGELEAVELYREIRARLNSKKHRDMLFEIITDEQEHATRFVYIYSMLK